MEIRLYKRKVIAPLIPALIMLKPTINGIRLHTALLGTPMKRGVMIKLAIIMVMAIEIVPRIRPMTADFFDFFLL